MIEDLSAQIKSDVEKINTSIDDPNIFNSLSKTVKKRVCCRLEQVCRNICSTVIGFKSTLKHILVESRGRILHEVGILTNKIEKHVQYTKNQLERYINKTDELESYLKCKANIIDSISGYLLGTLSISNKISRLTYPKGRINETYIVKHDVPFVREYIPQLKEFTNKLYGLLYDKEYTLYVLQERIEKLVKFLEEILVKDPTNDIIIGNRSFEFHPGGGRRYDKELEQIRESILKAFELSEKISELRRRVRPLAPFVNFFKEIAELKLLMEPIRDYIKPNLLSFIKDIENIKTTKEDIINYAKGMDNGIQKTIRKLHNAQKIIKFLQVVEDKLTVLRGVPKPTLENIGGHISKLKDWKVAANATQKRVHLAFRENMKQIKQIDRHDDISSGPVQIKGYIDRVVPKLRVHIEQKITVLEIVGEIKKQLDIIKSAGTNLKGVKGQNETSDIEKALEYLKEVDGKLSEASKSIESTIAQVKTNYEQNENKINGTDSSNGNGIESHVDEINQIPDKIAELHSKIKYNIVILNIPKSVDEILKNLGEKLVE